MWGLRVWGSRFEVKGSKFEVQNLRGLEVEGLGFKMLTCSLRVTARL